jgi:hypothetical protein
LALLDGARTPDNEGMDSKTIPRRRTVALARGVSVPFDVAVNVITRDPSLLVGSPVTPSWVAPEGRELIGLGLSNGLHLGREVRVGLGTVFSEGDAVVVPLWMEAAEYPHLFPVFHGGLEIRPDGDVIDLRLVGSYRPPLGAVGRFADAMVGHLVVIGSLESLLAAAAERLAAAAAAAPTAA